MTMSPHDWIEIGASFLLTVAWWQMRVMAASLRRLELQMQKCVSFDSLSKTAKELHDKINHHGERIARLEPR